MSGPSADLRARILGATRTKPSPTRAALARRRIVAAASSVLWVSGWAIAMRAHVPPFGGLVLLLVWTLGAAAATGVVFAWPRKSALGAPRGLLRGVGPVIAALVLFGAIVVGELWGHAGAIEGNHLECIAASLVVAAGPLATGFWVERGGDPIAPGASGAALGAIAGAWAGVAMSFVCGRTEVLHTFVAHAGVLVVLVALAALVGRRVLAMR